MDMHVNTDITDRGINKSGRDGPTYSTLLNCVFKAGAHSSVRSQCNQCLMQLPLYNKLTVKPQTFVTDIGIGAAFCFS